MKVTQAMREEARMVRELVDAEWDEFVARGFLERSRCSWKLAGEREEEVYRLGWKVGYMAALENGRRMGEALMREQAAEN